MNLVLQLDRALLVPLLQEFANLSFAQGRPSIPRPSLPLPLTPKLSGLHTTPAPFWTVETMSSFN